MQDWDKIFSIKSNEEFDSWALRVFEFQYKNCEVYRDFCQRIGRTNPRLVEEIPFLPISFFKSHVVKNNKLEVLFDFKSSGTTGAERSVHPIQNEEIYQQSFLQTYKSQIGSPSEQVILALLPSYVEQGESSLVYMVDRLIKETNNPLSGFVLNQFDALIDAYKKAIKTNKKVVIFGVSYALLDLAEQGCDLSQALIIETGGMKGRRKELTKEELHAELSLGLNCKNISSEYGMTELFSQAYLQSDQFFTLPPWMRVRIRETNDPFAYPEDGKTGGINVIDLANVFSCSFISTQDLGRMEEGRLQLMGRFDNADLRGCNLLVQ